MIFVCVCVCIVALFIILYISAVQNPTPKALSARPHFYFPRTVSDKEVTICLPHLPRSTSMQSMTHFVSVSRKGERKKKKKKQNNHSASSLNTFVIRLRRIEWGGGVDMTLFFFFTLSHLLPDISGAELIKKKIILFFFLSIKPLSPAERLIRNKPATMFR